MPTIKPPRKLKGLKLKNLRPATIVNRSFVPIDQISRPRSMARSMGTRRASMPASLPGGRALVGTVKAFGIRDATVEIAELDDGTTNSIFHLVDDGFEFGMMFKRFSPPGSDLFKLDDMKVVLKQKSRSRTGSVMIGGKLRMDSDILAPFRDFVGSEESIVLGSEFRLKSGEEITGKIDAREFTLSAAAPFHVELDEGRIAFSELTFNLEVKRGPNDRGWRIEPSLSGKLQLNNLTDGFTELECQIRYEDGSLQVSANVDEITIAALGRVEVNDLNVNFTVGNENEIDLTAKAKIGRKRVELAGVLTPSYCGLCTKIDSLSIGDISALSEQLSMQPIDSPEFRLGLKEVTIGLATADCTVGEHELSQGVSLSGRLTVHGFEVEATASFDSDGVKFSAEMEEVEVGPVTISSPNLLMELYTQRSEKPAKFEINGKTTVEGITVDCSLIFQKGAGSRGWDTIVYAGVDVNRFTLAEIIPGVEPDSLVGDIGFVRAAIIYASGAAEVTAGGESFQAEKGLQLVGELHPIPQLTQLVGEAADKGGMELRAFFGAESGIGISMPESTRLHLSDSVSCDPFEIKIVALPKPELNLIFGVNVGVPSQDDDLHFDFQLSVSALDAAGSGTMKGYWEDPFGLDGLKIGPNTALEVGIEYQVFSVSGIPSKFGIVGGLQMGEIVAAMAAGIATSPTDMILYGEVQKLTPDNLISFANEISGSDIPSDAIPDFFELNQLKLYAAPAGGSIGTVVFDRGFSFNADLTFFGKTANCYFRVGDDGLEAKGEIDQLKLGPLTIGGRRGDNLIVDLALTTERQGVRLDGEIDFLGSSIGLYADVSKNGVEFEFEQSFLGLMTFTVNGKSEGSLLKPRSLDFMLTAEFENRLTEYLKTTVSNKIEEAIQVVEQDIDAAKAEVERTQQAYEAEFDHAIAELDGAQVKANQYLQEVQGNLAQERENYSRKINEARAEVERTRAIFNAAFQRAQNEVTNAQRKLNQSVRAASAKVEQTRRKFNDGVRNAQNSLNQAQRNYNLALDQARRKIRAAQGNVNSLLGQIRNTQRILDNLAWYESYKALYYGPKIAGLWVAHKVATGALWVAEQFVDKIARAAVGLALNAARGALHIAKIGANKIAFDGAQSALETARRIGQGALEAAKHGLEIVRHGVEFAAFDTAQRALDAVEASGRFALSLAEEAVRTIGQSAVYLAFEAAKGTVTAVRNGTSALAFESAKLVLEGAKLGATTVMRMAQWVAENVGNIIDIKRVKLSASLKEIQRGKFFEAEIDIVLFGTEYNWTLDFDINNIGEFIENLFKEAFSTSKKLASA